jgi:hypothetical protein
MALYNRSDANSKLGVYQDAFFGPQIIKGTTYDVGKTMAAGVYGHYGYPDFPPERDIGGDFVLYGREHNRAKISALVRGTGAWGNDSYSGIISCSTSAGPPDAGSWSPADWGAEAFSKMKPTAPTFSGLNSIYELKDLPGMLQQQMVKGNLKNMSNYWLALQFGWKPLLNDIRRMIDFQVESQRKMDFLLRNNGKLVRRRIVLFDRIENEVITTGEAWGLMNPGFVNYFYSGTPTYRSRAFTRDSVWGSAAFRFWLPSSPKGIVYKSALRRALFGLTPSPSIIYNMIPWSWLVDWFSNTGYVINNLDAGVADRLAADWFYMMRKKEHVIQTELSIPLHDMSKKPIVLHGTAEQTSFSKVRLRGSPFGWAISQNSLNPMQLSILGALGLSKIG